MVSGSKKLAVLPLASSRNTPHLSSHSPEPSAAPSHPIKSAPLSDADILQLQRTVGNRAVQRLLASSRPPPAIQRKYVLKEDRVAAMEALKSAFPRIKDSVNSNAGDAADAFWEKYLPGQAYRDVVGGLVSSALKGAEEKDYFFSVTLREEAGGTHLRMMISCVKDPMKFTPDNTVFSVNYYLHADEGKLGAYVETIAGAGRGKRIFREALLPLAKATNMKEMTLKASRLGGSGPVSGMTVWARYGFIPTPTDWNTMRTHALKGISETAVKPDWMPKVQAILEDENPRAVRKLVLIAWGGNKAAGEFLDAMLTHDAWNGMLPLDGADLAWISQYVTEAEQHNLQKYASLV